MNLALPALGRALFRKAYVDIKKTANSVFFYCLAFLSVLYILFNVCLVLCRGREATSKTYRNPKQPCINDSMFDVAYKFSLAIV